MFDTVKPLPPSRDSLLPNHYAPDYLLSLHFLTERASFELLPETKDWLCKVYRFAGKFYAVPRTTMKPPEGFNWERVVKRRGRTIWMATRRISA